MRSIARSLLALAAAAAPLAAASTPAPVAAQTHPFTVRDLLAMQRISENQASPDGRQVVFVLRTTDLEANKGRNDLWIVGSDGKGLRQLTRDEGSETSPRWSPDGRAVYYLSTHGGSSQVWRLAVDGGEAAAPSQVTALPVDVGSFALSPDGTQLVVSAETFVDCADLACSAKRSAGKAEKMGSGRLYDRLFVRHWDTWSEGTRSHLFVLPANAAAATAAKDLMPGMDADAPSKPFGGAEEYTFAPDSKTVVFSARDAGAGEPWSTDFDLYAVPVDGSAKPRNLTDANPAWDTQPVFSPDGRTLAYLAMKRPGYESDRFGIMLMSWPEGTPRELAADWDFSADGLLFSKDGKTLYTSPEEKSQHPLVAFDLATGKPRTLVARGHVRTPVLAGDRLVFGLDTWMGPVELYSVKNDGTDLRPITAINAERLAATRRGTPEQFSFAGWNGDTVYGYVFQPADFEPGKKYPVAFLIHGGPQGAWGNDFHYRWNPQTYAGAGYGVVVIDFHGSTGYGQAFTDAINREQGSRPLEDLQKGWTAALAKYPWLDGSNACALGASYGGFMVNWIEGNWPDTFKCLVTHDGIFDERMMYYATEELWFPEWEFGGPEWQARDTYEKWNPVNFVDRWQTPMLVVHSEQDFRIPYDQGLAAFTALQRRGVPSQLLVFPDENHWVLKPQNSLQWHDTVLAWLARWLGPGAATP